MVRKVKLEAVIYKKYKDKIESLMAAIERNFQIQSSETIFTNISRDDLKNAAEMFMFLKITPGSSQSWSVFYTRLFQTKSAQEIIMTLNRVMKKNLEKDDNIGMNINVFKKLTTLLKLKYTEINK